MIKIGSRKSPLAMRQAEIVLKKLQRAFPDERFEIVGIATTGDRQLDKPLAGFGGKGVFIKELEAAALSGEIQMAVHSAKDMPTELPDGFCIAAVTERGAHEDVLVCPPGFESRVSADAEFAIGTGSARREVQLRQIYPNAEIKPIRGNIHTRLEKMRSGEYNAIVLAKAALERLETENVSVIPLDFVCAAGQGIIAVEVRRGEAEKYAEAINDKNTYLALTAEREFLRAVGGGCHSPVGAYAEVKNGVITMETLRFKEGKIIRKKMSGANPKDLARKMAEDEKC